jgi:hypothetical protein
MCEKQKLNLEEIMAAAVRNDCTGFCVSCGFEQGGCEPDARNYECENCGSLRVFGAEQLLLEFA